MTIDLLTLFPGMAQAVMGESILGRAQRAGLVKIRVHQLRDYARDRHKTVDDRPFGGGPGMGRVMTAPGCRGYGGRWG